MTVPGGTSFKNNLRAVGSSGIGIFFRSAPRLSITCSPELETTLHSFAIETSIDRLHNYYTLRSNPMTSKKFWSRLRVLGIIMLTVLEAAAIYLIPKELS